MLEAAADLSDRVHVTGRRFLPAFKANAKAPGEGGAERRGRGNRRARLPTQRPRPALHLHGLARTNGPPLARCSACSEPTGKLCSRRAARRGGADGRRRRREGEAGRHARAEGTARRPGRARARVGVGRVGAAQQSCDRCLMLRQKENGRRRAASSSHDPRWKLELPPAGSRRPRRQKVVRHACIQFSGVVWDS